MREACIAAGFFPIGMEYLPARDASGVAVSLEMVDKVDIYRGIYGWRYGWVPDGKTISITEMEFDRAVERKAAGAIRETPRRLRKLERRKLERPPQAESGRTLNLTFDV